MIRFLLAWMLLQQPGARIAGVVVNDDGMKPVRHALVTLSSGSGTAGATMITGDDGAFAFANLSEGRYRLSASKPGFPETAFGARPGRDIAVPIALGAGQQLTSLQLRLARGAVITGTVLGVTGEPVAGVSVIAGRILTSQTSGERTFVGLGQSISDEDGTYRIYGLPEGDFVVTAWPKPAANDTITYGPTSYPSTTNIGDAPVISLHAGDERSGADITLHQTQRAAVAGVVLDPNGRPANDVPVTLAVVDAGGVTVADAEVLSVRTGAGGAFLFPVVLNGAYVATVNDNDSDPSAARMMPARRWARADVAVNGRDVTGLTLSLRAGTPVSASPDRFGAFPTPSTGGARGVLADPRGAPATDFIVVVFPAERARWTDLQASARTVPPDTNGEWSVTGLPPGQYRIAAITDWMTFSVVTPALLEQLMDASASIAVTAGELTTINLRVGG